jgi:hypothetical protein
MWDQEEEVFQDVEVQYLKRKIILNKITVT